MFRNAILLLILLAPLPATAQDLVATHNKIKSAVEERNYLLAKSELNELRSKQREVFEANNYDYLLARVSDKSGDTAAAMANYQAVVKRDSIFKEYAIWHLSQIARASGNLVLERLQLQQLVSFAPESLLQKAARARLVRSYFESNDYASVIRIASSPTDQAAATQDTTQQLSREDTVLLAESYYKTGNIEKARDYFMSLITNLPNPAQPDDFALAGVRGLDLLESDSASPLSDYDHLKRAQIYQFNRDFAGARNHFLAIVNGFPSSGIAPDALYQIGRGYSQQANFVDAVSWYERILEQFPDHAVAKDALLQLATAYTRLGKHKEAVVRYKTFIEKYPDEERLDRAYLNIVDVLRDNRDETHALEAAEAAREKFKGKLAEALAVFVESRIYISRSDWKNALASLETLRTFPDLGGATVAGGTNTAEITFLRGFVLEQLRRYDEAIDAYLSIPDGRNEYYGGRATERLRFLAGSDEARSIAEAKLKTLLDASRSSNSATNRENIQSAIRLTTRIEEREKILADLRKIYAELPAYKNSLTFKIVSVGRETPVKKAAALTTSHKDLANELWFLGLYDEASSELEATLNAEQKIGKTKTDLDYTLADIYRRGDMANRAASFIEPTWKVPADYQMELIPDNVLQMLYPIPYVDALRKSAAPRDVDPRFLLSIMRQESRFRSDAKSYAAARGLMQFISSTADRIAGELGRDNFRQDELYDPSTAVLFGSQYVSDLQKFFPNQLPAVAASYNGGEDNMMRWLARSKTDLADRYIPEVGFSQSKDYVYRVMTNYRMYQMLYDEDLKRLK
jgi:soluble lytic murein transglycosylase